MGERCRFHVAIENLILFIFKFRPRYEKYRPACSAKHKERYDAVEPKDVFIRIRQERKFEMISISKFLMRGRVIGADAYDLDSCFCEFWVAILISAELLCTDH